MTVKEAFEKAGYPVIDGARISIEGRNWYFSVNNQLASVFSDMTGCPCQM